MRIQDKYHISFSKILDCEQSLFCSKIPAGGVARKRVRYSSREPRAASSVGGRVSEEWKERLPCFHTAFLKPGTLVTEYFDWSVYDPMACICHHHFGDMQCVPTAVINRIADRNRRKHIKLLDTKLAVSRGVIHTFDWSQVQPSITRYVALKKPQLQFLDEMGL